MFVGVQEPASPDAVSVRSIPSTPSEFTFNSADSMRYTVCVGEKGEREGERERERVCVCVCVFVYESMCEWVLYVLQYHQ